MIINDLLPAITHRVLLFSLLRADFLLCSKIVNVYPLFFFNLIPLDQFGAERLRSSSTDRIKIKRSKIKWARVAHLSQIQYLSTVTVEYPEYRRVALVGDVREHLEAVLHVVSPALYGVHGYVVVLELPGFGEFRVQDTEASEPVVLHHLRHLPLHHLHGISAGLDDGFHLVRVEEVAPQRQTYAQKKQRLRPEEKITHDATQKRQERHCVSYHHTQPNCSLYSPPFSHNSLHPRRGTMKKKSIYYHDFRRTD